MLTLNETIRNKESHIKNRVKGSGMITTKENEDEKVYIIAPNSKELFKIEEILKDVI